MSTELYSNNTTIILSVQNVWQIIYWGYTTLTSIAARHMRTGDTSTCEKMTISRAAVVVVIVVIETALCIPQQ
jgi:hypothetical protein